MSSTPASVTAADQKDLNPSIGRLHSLRRFVLFLRRDVEAVRNAISERWSNGQTEGQINRLKTLERSMYGWAGVGLLRARMLPLAQ
jgi:transposase